MTTTMNDLADVIFILEYIAFTYTLAIEAAIQLLEENNSSKALNVLRRAITPANKTFLDAVSEAYLEYAKSEMA
jgi:hypothetical protein